MGLSCTSYIHITSTHSLHVPVPAPPSFSPQVRKFATEQYATTGLHLHPHTNPLEVRKAGDGTLTVVLKGKDGQTSELTGADQVLMATGRVPKTQGLGLEEAGVKLGGGQARRCLWTLGREWLGWLRSDMQSSAWQTAGDWLTGWT